MRRRAHLSIHCETLIGAPEGAVLRALGRCDVWIRAARAVGARLEVAGGGPDLRSASLVRFRPGRLARPVLLRVRELPGAGELPGMRELPGLPGLAGLPVLESASAHSLVRIRISPTVSPAAGGTLAAVDYRASTPAPVLDAMLRPILVHYGEMLLAITILAASEPVPVVAGALIVEGRVLVAQRKSTGSADGKWELPGGKVEAGESEQQALRRELLEELAIRTRVSGRIGPTVVVSPGVQDTGMHLYCYRVEATHDDEIRLVDHDQYRWVGPDELISLDLLESDRQLIDSLVVALRA